MKVLLYSPFFSPSVGGLESVSLALANGFILNNVQCKVFTVTRSDVPDKFEFDVIRNPTIKQKLEGIKWADVILYNGASLALQPWVLFSFKPFIWIHAGYLVSCIDGSGWRNGERTPIHPIHSIIYYTKLHGLKWGFKEGSKLLIRRFFAKYVVNQNVAITDWMSQIQPLPRQVRIYNPFHLEKFLLSDFPAPEYDFIFLGRIISEKGISTLLKALSILTHQTNITASLLIIGNGKLKEEMEFLARDLGIYDLVTFVGEKTGQELAYYVSKGRIAIIPSEWYEPMGGVVLEMMAAGKNLIVSDHGGLKECVGDAGLTFPNGDHMALAQCMIKLLQDQSLRETQLQIAKERIQGFLPSIFISQYISLLKNIVKKSN